LGDDLIVTKRLDKTVGAYALIGETWTSIAPPSIQGTAVASVDKLAAQGNRVLLSEMASNGFTYKLHVFELNPDYSWNHLGTLNSAALFGSFVTFITDFTIRDNQAAALVVVDTGLPTLVVLSIESGSLEIVAQIEDVHESSLAISDETIFVGHAIAYAVPPLFAEGAVYAYEPGNNYVEQEIRLPPGQRESVVGLGNAIDSSGSGEVLVGSRNAGAFWLKKESGVWQLTPTGITQYPQDDGNNFWSTGGAGELLLHQGESWTPFRRASGMVPGEIRGSEHRKVLTNGSVIASGHRTYPATDVIEILHPHPLPPGC